MSRSRRHTPIRGWTGCESEKREKQRMHRRWRMSLRVALASGDYERATYDDYAHSGNNVCTWGKDGKGCFYGGEGEPWYERLMRK
jgi:hypothetical protein